MFGNTDACKARKEATASANYNSFIIKQEVCVLSMLVASRTLPAIMIANVTSFLLVDFTSLRSKL